MAYTRSWRELIDIASILGKGVGQLNKISPQICDFVSNDMYIEYPWKDTITSIAPATLPLINGQQDYSSPINIYRLTKASVYRRDVAPYESWELDIVDDNCVDLTPVGYHAITSCSQQQASGTLRLNSAVSVPSGTILEIHGEYQLNPIKIVDLNQDLWFKDQYAQVALEGLLYWVYKLSDDQRAGTAQTNANGGLIGYGGQLGVFKAALGRMRSAEDWGASNSLFPEETMGRGRDYDTGFIFGP